MAGPEGRLPLTIDWEDWFQLCCPPYDESGALDRFACRLPLATDLVLAFCEDLGATATWFCLADQAERHPALLRRIVAAGHAVGLHGLTHRRACQVDRKAFRRDLDLGRKILEDVAGAPVQGFRAPEWSLRGTAERYWEDIQEAGFRYDSSRAPLALLGSPERPRTCHRLRGDFWEFPPPVAGIGRATVPLWGWGMRTLPAIWLRRRLHALAGRQAGTPVVLHPWELDEGQPPLPTATFGHRFAHSAGLRNYGARLRRILHGLQLVSIESCLEVMDRG